MGCFLAVECFLLAVGLFTLVSVVVLVVFWICWFLRLLACCVCSCTLSVEVLGFGLGFVGLFGYFDFVFIYVL